MSEALITLGDVKLQCRLDLDFDYEDDLLNGYIAAALEVCQKHIGKRLGPEQEFTPALKVGCLMYIVFLYENRSSIADVAKSEVPMTVSALWNVYREPGVY
ncbi:head-tail connector protein [Serratia liquefaciens]|uniref:head-tail connector protein n=1 Tax=Serratia liquefaciens TaxID=614 RepID=UPI003905EA8E